MEITLESIDAVRERTGGILNTRSFAQLPDSQYEAANYEVGSIVRNITNIDGEYTTKSTAMGGDETTADFANKKLNDTQLDFGFYSNYSFFI